MEQDVEERGEGRWAVKGFGVRNAIARAILAEREHCATIADTALVREFDGGDFGEGVNYASRVITHLIRADPTHD